MKIRNTIFISLITFTLFHSCINPTCVTGIGSIENDQREVGEFDAIEVNTSFKIIIKDRVLSDNNKVEVQAQNNLLAYIKTTVEGGRLIITTDGCIEPTKPIEIYLKVNDISEIQLSGSGEIISQNTVHAENMALSCSGSGSMDISVKAENITLSNSASGLIRVDGKSKRSTVSLTGSGSIDAESLKVDEAVVVLSGSGSIKVHSTQKIALNHSGSGIITYSGNPEQKTELSTGSGSIVRQD